MAPNPHTPGHGSTHLVLTQALSRAQSALIVHSGRHPPAVGAPKNPGRHSHMAASPDFLQTVLIPHGEGLHGSLGGSSARKKKKIYFKSFYNQMKIIIQKKIYNYNPCILGKSNVCSSKGICNLFVKSFELVYL